MTDQQAKIYQVLRHSNAALSQTELARITGLSAEDVRKDCYALGAAGEINYRLGQYAINERKR